MTIAEGEELLLTCSVHQQIIWMRGFEVIDAGLVLLKIVFLYSVVLDLGLVG